MSRVGKRLIAEIRKVAEQSPDTKTEACSYVDPDGNGCCIVGRALLNLKMIGPEFRDKFANEEAFSYCYSEIEPLRKLDLKEVDWVKLVQAAQDGTYGPSENYSSPGYMSAAEKRKSFSDAVEYADQEGML